MRYQLPDSAILAVTAGSRAYGLETSDSDYDYKGVFLASPEEVWSLYGPKETITHRDDHEDITLWEVRHFIKLGLNGNPSILETLYGPVLYEDPTGSLLREERDLFLSRELQRSYQGYAYSQLRRIMNAPVPNWKHAMHCIRLLLTCLEVVTTGEMRTDVGPHRGKLRSIRDGEWTQQRVDTQARALMGAIDMALGSSPLPEHPDRERAERLLLDIRGAGYKLSEEKMP